MGRNGQDRPAPNDQFFGLGTPDDEVNQDELNIRRKQAETKSRDQKDRRIQICLHIAGGGCREAKIAKSISMKIRLREKKYPPISPSA